MTLNQIANTPEILIGLMSAMLSVLLTCAGLLYKIAKAIVPVLTQWRLEFVEHKTRCDGRFLLIDERFSEHTDDIQQIGERIGTIEIKIQEKYR